MTETITLRKLAARATPGPWVKGKTTHHTVTIKGYHIAEWHHADDAALMDALYPQKVIELLDEIDSLRAALAQQAVICNSDLIGFLPLEGKMLQTVISQTELRSVLAQQAEAAKEELHGCACRWDAYDNRVDTCVRHQGWLDVVQEWSERAKAAEAQQVAQQAEPTTSSMRFICGES